MKDLRHFITKLDTKKNIEQEIDNDDPSKFEFLSFCIFNSFYEEKNYAENFYRMGLHDEIWLPLSFYGWDSVHLEDYDISSDFIKDTVLNALLPSYFYDECCSYCEGKLSNPNDLVDLFDFLKKYKAKKSHIKWVKENASEDETFYAFIIKSKYLRKIYKNKTLKELFEAALAVEFIKPDTCIAIYCYFSDCEPEEQHVYPKYAIQFIKEYKKIYHQRRPYKKNSRYAHQMLAMDYDFSNCSQLIDDLLGTFQTSTEVMF